VGVTSGGPAQPTRATRATRALSGARRVSGMGYLDRARIVVCARSGYQFPGGPKETPGPGRTALPGASRTGHPPPRAPCFVRRHAGGPAEGPPKAAAAAEFSRSPPGLRSMLAAAAAGLLSVDVGPRLPTSNAAPTIPARAASTTDAGRVV
jgi:hypothetical protein